MVLDELYMVLGNKWASIQGKCLNFNLSYPGEDFFWKNNKTHSTKGEEEYTEVVENIRGPFPS